MTGSVTLRPATNDDLAFLELVYASTRQEELAPVPWTTEQKQAFLSMQFRLQHEYYHEHYAKAEYSIVLVDGQPSGRLYLDRREDEIRIVDIALLPGVRGKGIGTQLMGEVLGEADAKQLAVAIHVEKQNPARRLYERLGFREERDVGVYAFMVRAAR